MNAHKEQSGSRGPNVAAFIIAAAFVLAVFVAIVIYRHVMTAALQDATTQGDLDRAITNVKYGADVNAVDQNDETALAEACRREDVPKVEWLIEHGADVNQATTPTRAPLWIASDPGSNYPASIDPAPAKIITLLLDHGANPNITQMSVSPIFGVLCDPKLTKAMIDHGADLEAENGQGRTSLQDATLCAYINTIPVLVACGAHVDEPDDMGATALETASGVWGESTRRRYQATFKTLLKAGADPNAWTTYVRGFPRWAPPRPSEVHSIRDIGVVELSAPAPGATSYGYVNRFPIDISPNAYDSIPFNSASGWHIWGPAGLSVTNTRPAGFDFEVDTSPPSSDKAISLTIPATAPAGEYVIAIHNDTQFAKGHFTVAR